MPTYTFLNKITGEEFEEFMRMSEREKFLAEHPELEQTIKSVNIVDPVSIGVTRPPIDFQRHVLSKVKEMPGVNNSTIERRWSIPKET
jgi:hypothetical protein